MRGSIGWGWCNMVEDCEFESNYIGLILKNADNNVNVINSAMLVSTAATESSFGRLRNDQMNQMISFSDDRSSKRADKNDII